MTDGRRRARPGRLLAIVLATVVVLSACEEVTVARVNDRRASASLGSLAVAEDLTQGARAHSQSMCTAGAATPSADPVVAYRGAATTDVAELVGSAPMNPATADPGQRNGDAANLIWAQWQNDPKLLDPRWESTGVGEVECGDGKLYSTLVLRDDAPPIAAAGDTSRIQLVESVVQDGWKIDRYRNRAYPCSISGYQSFVIQTKVGSTDTSSRPLWVKMRGGGAGWFDPDGTPMPSSGVKVEESLTQQLKFDTDGLMAAAKAGPEGFRALIVSMCSHDIYAGNDNVDPYNPNRTPEGDRRSTNGLAATKAAIQYTMARYPTDDYVLHGTSAGGVGTFGVAWALQQQGIPPAALVSDSGVLNQEWQRYVAEHGIDGSKGCEKATEERGLGVLGRISPELGDPANQPHLLVSSGRLAVPVMHVWNHADNNVCGAVPIDCPLPGGVTVTMGAADCNHEPLRLAISALPAGTRSADMPVCVEGSDATVACDRHVVTTMANGVNSDPASPVDYQAAVLTWVRARLADD